MLLTTRRPSAVLYVYLSLRQSRAKRGRSRIRPPSPSGSLAGCEALTHSSSFVSETSARWPLSAAMSSAHRCSSDRYAAASAKGSTISLGFVAGSRLASQAAGLVEFSAQGLVRLYTDQSPESTSPARRHVKGCESRPISATVPSHRPAASTQRPIAKPCW